MATPILAEHGWRNNRPGEVIHRLGTLQSCVFHSIHIFQGNTQRCLGKLRTTAVAHGVSQY